MPRRIPKLSGERDRPQVDDVILQRLPIAARYRQPVAGERVVEAGAQVIVAGGQAARQIKLPIGAGGPARRPTAGRELTRQRRLIVTKDPVAVLIENMQELDEILRDGSLRLPAKCQIELPVFQRNAVTDQRKIAGEVIAQRVVER